MSLGTPSVVDRNPFHEGDENWSVGSVTCPREAWATESKVFPHPKNCRLIWLIAAELATKVDKGVIRARSRLARWEGIGRLCGPSSGDEQGEGDGAIADGTDSPRGRCIADPDTDQRGK